MPSIMLGTYGSDPSQSWSAYLPDTRHTCLTIMLGIYGCGAVCEGGGPLSNPLPKKRYSPTKMGYEARPSSSVLRLRWPLAST
jgi:hypothetical protein